VLSLIISGLLKYSFVDRGCGCVLDYWAHKEMTLCLTIANENTFVGIIQRTRWLQF
jgi:hypothetical protein